MLRDPSFTDMTSIRPAEFRLNNWKTGQLGAGQKRQPDWKTSELADWAAFGLRRQDGHESTLPATARLEKLANWGTSSGPLLTGNLGNWPNWPTFARVEGRTSMIPGLCACRTGKTGQLRLLEGDLGSGPRPRLQETRHFES